MRIVRSFKEIRNFFSFVCQIFCNYIENYIVDKKINLDHLEKIIDCLIYDYAFFLW